MSKSTEKSCYMFVSNRPLFKLRETNQTAGQLSERSRHTDTERNSPCSSVTPVSPEGSLSVVTMTTTPFTPCTPPAHTYTHINYIYSAEAGRLEMFACDYCERADNK